MLKILFPKVYVVIHHFPKYRKRKQPKQRKCGIDTYVVKLLAGAHALVLQAQKL